MKKIESLQIWMGIVSLLISAAAQALPASETADLPFLYPDHCAVPKSIVIPEGLEGTSYYFNRDCTVAYIVPPPTANVDVSKPVVFENMRLCPAVQSSMSSVLSLFNQIQTLINHLGSMAADDPRRASVAASIESLQESAKKLNQSFVGVPGMTVQMNFKGSLTPEYMKSITNANLPWIEQGNLKIRPAPIEKSYLSFNVVIPGTTQTFSGNPVLESNIMGILSQADESASQRGSVRFDGSAEGYVTLSLIAACPMVSGDFKDLPSLQLNEAAVAGTLSATHTMLVPVMNSFGYEAKFDVDNATKIITEKFGHQGKFTASDIQDLFLSGSVSQALSVSSWTFENLSGELETQYISNMSLENINKIKSALMAQYLDQLVEFKALSVVKDLATPTAGDDVRTGERQVCWRNSSWLGLVNDSGCRNETYQFLVPTDGSSHQLADIVNQMKGSFSDRAEFLHPTSRVYTTSFVLKQGGQQ